MCALSQCMPQRAGPQTTALLGSEHTREIARKEPHRQLLMTKAAVLAFEPCFAGAGEGGGGGSCRAGSSREPPHSLTTSVTAPDAAGCSAEPSAALKATSSVLTTEPAQPAASRSGTPSQSCLVTRFWPSQAPSNPPNDPPKRRPSGICCPSLNTRTRFGGFILAGLVTALCRASGERQP